MSKKNAKKGSSKDMVMPLDWQNAATMIGNYYHSSFKWTKVCQDKNGYDVIRTIFGFRLDKIDIKSLKDNGAESFFIMPGLKMPSQEMTLIVAGLNDTTGEIIFTDAQGMPNQKPVMEYCDPCPPKCPANFADKLKYVLGTSFFPDGQGPECTGCKA